MEIFWEKTKTLLGATQQLLLFLPNSDDKEGRRVMSCQVTARLAAQIFPECFDSGCQAASASPQHVETSPYGTFVRPDEL